jgi:hypothetical protein
MGGHNEVVGEHKSGCRFDHMIEVRLCVASAGSALRTLHDTAAVGRRAKLRRELIYVNVLQRSLKT